MPVNPTDRQKQASRINGDKGGRPKGPKKYILEVRFDTEEEKQKVIAKGGSKFIRQLLHDNKVISNNAESSVTRHDIIAPDVLRELSKIGNNLNQLAKWCNTHKAGAEAVAVVYELAKIESEIKAVLPKVVYSERSDAH